MKKYEILGNTLYNGDCLEFFEEVEQKSIDTVITSPPYNTMRPNATDRGYDEYKGDKSDKEYINFTLKVFEGYDKVLKENGVVLYNMSYGGENTILMNLVISEIIKESNFILADTIIWKKKTATPNNVSHNKLTRICEFIYVFCRKDEFYTFNTNKKVVGERETGQLTYENIQNFIIADNNDESNDLNKATYSTDLVLKLMDIYCKDKSVVMDNFSGTGTTLKACISKDYKFIGCELSKAQCEYTKKRIDKGVQISMF